MTGLMRLSKTLKYLLSIYFFINLVGCSRQQITLNPQTIALPTMQMRLEQEAMLMRMNDLLLANKISRAERASLYFERAVLYDSLGLWSLAYYDFAKALVLQPKMAEAYNYLGLYRLLNTDYEMALNFFEKLFELDPNYDYGFFNRALVFYYFARYDLAQLDFERFYAKNPSDSYRTLWLYLNELQYQPQQAVEKLTLRAKSLSNKEWGTYLVQYYLGNVSLSALMQQAQQFADLNAVPYAEVLTETYFYVAKQKLIQGQVEEAQTLFKLATANPVYNFVEYRFAMFELLRLQANQTGVAQ